MQPQCRLGSKRIWLQSARQQLVRGRQEGELSIVSPYNSGRTSTKVFDGAVDRAVAALNDTAATSMQSALWCNVISRKCLHACKGVINGEDECVKRRRSQETGDGLQLTEYKNSNAKWHSFAAVSWIIATPMELNCSGLEVTKTAGHRQCIPCLTLHAVCFSSDVHSSWACTPHFRCFSMQNTALCM